MLEGMILKPNMVLPGLTCPKQETVDEVADTTVKCLLRAVPAAVPGIAFLSGGQSCELASARLNAMNVRFKSRLPWALGVFICARHPTTCFGDLARQRSQRARSTRSSYIIELNAIGLHAVVNTLPRWKGYEIVITEIPLWDQIGQPRIKSKSDTKDDLKSLPLRRWRKNWVLRRRALARPRRRND